MTNTVSTPESTKTCIKTSAMLLIDGLPYRYGEFLADLQAQMSTMERGKMFFDVRLAVQELIEEGKLVVLDFETPGRSGKLIAPAGFKLNVAPTMPDVCIDALKALNAENWLDEDPADTDALAAAKAQARSAVASYDTIPPRDVNADPAVEDAGLIKAQALIAELEQMHPDISWSLFPLGDYDQYAEVNAPDVLVSFGSADEAMEEGLVDPYSTMLGEVCEPAHWGLSVDAAQLILAHNQVSITKYPNCDAPKYQLVNALAKDHK